MRTNLISDFEQQNLATMSSISNVGHALFFSALFILNNPYVFLDTEIRFGLFLITLTFGAMLIFLSEPTKRQVNTIAWIVLIVLYGIAAVRINTVGSMNGFGGTSEQAQALVTIYSIFVSSSLATRLNIYKMNISLLFVSGICFIPIFLYSSDLFDYYQKDSFRLGVLTYDSYQAASQIIGFFAISLISFVSSKRRSLLVYLFTFILVLLAFYTVTLSPARGEAIALATAIFILAVSKSKLGYVAIGGVAILTMSDSFIETTLGSRLSGVAAGDFGERDYLFKLAVSQFFGDFYTILVGTGLNGFQFFNNLPLELYPHNFLLEGMIVGGFSLFFVLVYIFIVPILRLFLLSDRTPQQSLSLSVMVFLVMINLKSGTLVSFWGMGCYAAIFLSFSPTHIKQLYR